jgi:hypothetical protein
MGCHLIVKRLSLPGDLFTHADATEGQLTSSYRWRVAHLCVLCKGGVQLVGAPPFSRTLRKGG